MKHRFARGWFWSAAFVLAYLSSAFGQTAPHGIVSIAAGRGGTISLELTGSPPSQFRPYFDIFSVDCSDDLRVWKPFRSLLRTNSSSAQLLCLDTNSEARPIRFYRIATNHAPTAFPQPTGPLRVGTRSLLLRDPSRTNRYNVATNSSFMITLWFPTPEVAGMAHTPYIEQKLSSSLAGLYGVSSTVLSGLYAHSFPTDHIRTNEAPYPVIIYSHGFRVNRRDNTARLEDLASHGYVVVAIDHADALTTVFPDGRLLSTTIPDLSRPLFTNNVRDILFVLKELSRLNEEDASLRGALDLQNVGTMGWSYGGGVAAEVCRSVPAVRAVVLLDAYLQNADTLLTYGCGKPFISMHRGAYGGNRSLLDLATKDAFWMTILGTEHQTYADWLAWLSGPTNASRRAAVVMNACTVSFFNRYLKNIDDGLFDNPAGTFPEIANYVRK